jgi:hypothetical protein
LNLLIEASELRILEPRVVLQSVVADLHRARIAFDLDPVQDAQVLKIDGVRRLDPRLDWEIECGRGFMSVAIHRTGFAEGRA